jgi:DNA invertase Pin-like site-specific DNA recombinase
MRAAIYVQDSTVRAERDLFRQEMELRRLVADRGYDDIEVFLDTDPVGESDRPGLNALREAIRERRFYAVFALSAENLSLDPETLRDFADECRQAGTNVEIPGFAEAVA